ncbi:MAG: hypothetical protein H7Y01_09075 [Ferruginibacter sp.]|nr:hypothetical protein [Chitinophagaceae bacterium]
MKRILTISIISVIVFTGCYRDNEAELYPGNTVCDTNGVTYLATVAPILQGNGCVGCHSGASPSGNISLEIYNNVKTIALNGKLFGTINHTAGFSPMPKGGNKMSPCSINKIKAWIDAGALNN